MSRLFLLFGKEICLTVYLVCTDKVRECWCSHLSLKYEGFFLKSWCMVYKYPYLLTFQELQQVVKLGRASYAAREAVTEGSESASDTLLNDYALATPNAGSTPRTPAPTTDRILQVNSILSATSFKCLKKYKYYKIM